MVPPPANPQTERIKEPLVEVLRNVKLNLTRSEKVIDDSRIWADTKKSLPREFYTVVHALVYNSQVEKRIRTFPGAVHYLLHWSTTNTLGTRMRLRQPGQTTNCVAAGVRFDPSDLVISSKVEIFVSLGLYYTASTMQTSLDRPLCVDWFRENLVRLTHEKLPESFVWIEGIQDTYLAATSPWVDYRQSVDWIDRSLVRLGQWLRP